MTTFGWCWLIGGLPLAAVLAVLFERDRDSSDGEWVCGLVFLAVWVATPFVVALGVLCGVLAAVSWTVRCTADAIPLAPSREDLLERIADLERELEIAPRGDESVYPRQAS